MEDSRDFRMPIPAMTITDYPAISYRAVHFDVKHHWTEWNIIIVPLIVWHDIK